VVTVAEGFAIEFDEKEIREFAEAERAKWQYQGILLNGVCYRNYEKVVDLKAIAGLASAMVKVIIGHHVPKARDKLLEILGPKDVDDYAAAYLSNAPFLKHPGFEEESEFRIAALSNRVGFTDAGDTRAHKSVHFRSLGDARVAPYIILGETDDVKLPIKSILVGPNPHQASQMTALEIMLSELGIKGEVRSSRIPFRS
jgi:hypothetical protein